VPVTETAEVTELKRLAKLYGVQTTYHNAATRRRHERSPEALLAILRALRAPVQTLSDAASAARERKTEIWGRVVEPVTVAWDGRLRVTLRLPTGFRCARLSGVLDLESGEKRQLSFDLSHFPPVRSARVDGLQYAIRKLVLPARLPRGYHRLHFETRGSGADTLIVAAPATAYDPAGVEQTWGIFIPLYAMHSRRTIGAGDLAELEAIADWTVKLGGRFVSTLPLLASFLDSPCDPSPYAPASRLFWNEFYLRLERIPEWRHCRPARMLSESTEVRSAVKALRAQMLVDYRRIMTVKRGILEKLSRWFYSHSAAGHTGFQQFLKESPCVKDYAAFRAAGERQRCGWGSWPQRMRRGILTEADYDPEAQRYHVYVQWQMHDYLRSLSEKSRRRGLTFCLDLPLGIHANSYDVWRKRDIFALGVHGGAPPDAVFTKGQDWGFPPLDPNAMRREGYQYWIDCLRHQMAHAGLLRVDHIMGLHRLFWIPEGFDAREGVYVRYRSEELYAILALESWRNRSMTVGENLGAVPAYVNSAMTKRKVKQMYVLQYELAATSPRRRLRDPSPDEVASLNTHDMPTFCAFLKGLDIQDRLESDLLSEAKAAAERKKRDLQRKELIKTLRRKRCLGSASPGARTLMKASLEFLSGSRSPIAFVNLEDLWLETQPQNTPAASDRPNWRRKLRHAREVLSRFPEVIRILGGVASIRRGRGHRRVRA
jgi:4-alpha-glucanotransferase